MDIATVVGLLAAISLVGVAIGLGTNPAGFVDIPSLILVIGGAIAATITRFTLKNLVVSMGSGIAAAMRGDGVPLPDLVEKISELADVVRKSGPLGLETVVVDDPFLAKGVRYIADGYEIEFIRESLEKDRDNLLARLEVGQKAFKFIGDAAPAFGMIGTLVGLVQMLGNMSDPSTIGPSMAVALLTTLYGALIANVIALPLHDKISVKTEVISTSMSLIIDGVLLMRDNKSPAVIRDLLFAYMDEKTRSKMVEAA